MKAVLFMLVALVPLTGLAKEAKPVRPEVLARLQAKAENGVADAQLQLGSHYAQGDGVSKDLTEAVKWYRKAAPATGARRRVQGKGPTRTLLVPTRRVARAHGVGRS